MEANAETLFSDLEGQPYDEAVNLIYNFCIQNNAVGVLSDGQMTLSFGEMESETISTATTNIFGIIHFADRTEEYALSITSISQTTNEISNLLLKLIPVIFGVILLLSALSAFICSRVIVSPIAEISQISKRMTALDMTWRCDVKSKDEIGILASSLNTMATLLPLAQDKNIQIRQDVGTDRSLLVNPALWSKALSNIIGNAVRYSPSGAEVSVFLRDKNVLVIENTGVTIPEDDLPHLFTPFYRSDKSRNRATGGSGLGLYIVKTILDLHDMTYCIYNTQNGVAFEIRFKPKSNRTHIKN